LFTFLLFIQTNFFSILLSNTGSLYCFQSGRLLSTTQSVPLVAHCPQLAAFRR